MSGSGESMVAKSGVDSWFLGFGDAAVGAVVEFGGAKKGAWMLRRRVEKVPSCREAVVAQRAPKHHAKDLTLYGRSVVLGRALSSLPRSVPILSMPPPVHYRSSPALLFKKSTLCDLHGELHS